MQPMWWVEWGAPWERLRTGAVGRLARDTRDKSAVGAWTPPGGGRLLGCRGCYLRDLVRHGGHGEFGRVEDTCSWWSPALPRPIFKARPARLWPATATAATWWWWITSAPHDSRGCQGTGRNARHNRRGCFGRLLALPGRPILPALHWGGNLDSRVWCMCLHGRWPDREG